MAKVVRDRGTGRDTAAVVLDITMSLDGLITGPEPGPDQPRTRVIESPGVTHLRFRVVR